MSKFARLFVVSAALALSALPAFAEGNEAGEWLSRTFRMEKAEHRSQSVDRHFTSRHNSERADREDSSSRSRKSIRVARAESESDSRPQRHAASKPRPKDSLSGRDSESGMASYYWEPQALASGGRFNPNAMTAAHKTLPFGTRVRVTRVDNGQSVDVTINDRGPYVGGRIIDLSKRAASELNMTNAGVARVRMTVLGRG